MDLNRDLQDKVTVVTGGSRGIGYAIVQALAPYGPKIVIANRSEAEGRVAAERINAAGGSAMPISTDVSNRASVIQLVQKTVAEFGRIDLLINNAGVGIRKPAIDYAEEEIDLIMDINLKGLFFCSQEVAKVMIGQGGGKMINMSSMAALFGLVNRAPYCGSKGGVSQLTRAFALEWARHGIQVNAIAPGIIATPLTTPYMEANPERVQNSLRKLPAGRFGEPADVVGAVLFLASGAADYITGQVIAIDGGYSLGCMDW
jgi:NAD(P)-dependent dehydrogenase (short-subunit alcohol dehydrogenase family)